MGNYTAKQARTLGILLLVTERCKMTELGAEAFGFGYVAMLDSILKKEIRLLNFVISHPDTTGGIAAHV